MGNLISLGASSPDANLIGNGALVEGDVALAGSGSATVNGGAQAVGTVYRKTGGTLTLNNGGVVTGGSVQNASTDSFLNQGVMDANNASNAAFALAASAGYPTTINANSSLTLSGSGTVVLKLTDFMLSSGAALTLQGSATTTFIVNVSKKFSLSNGPGFSSLAGCSGTTYSSTCAVAALRSSLAEVSSTASSWQTAGP